MARPSGAARQPRLRPRPAISGAPTPVRCWCGWARTAGSNGPLGCRPGRQVPASWNASAPGSGGDGEGARSERAKDWAVVAVPLLVLLVLGVALQSGSWAEALTGSLFAAALVGF